MTALRLDLRLSSTPSKHGFSMSEASLLEPEIFHDFFVIIEEAV